MESEDMKSEVIAYMLSILDLYPWSVRLSGNIKFAELAVNRGEDDITFLFSEEEVAAMQEACMAADYGDGDRPLVRRALSIVSELLDVFNPYGEE